MIQLFCDAFGNSERYSLFTTGKYTVGFFFFVFYMNADKTKGNGA